MIAVILYFLGGMLAYQVASDYNPKDTITPIFIAAIWPIILILSFIIRLTSK